MTSPGLLSALPKDLKARIVSFLPRQFKEPDDYAEEEAWSGSEEAEEDVDCESDIAALSLVNKELDAVAADLQFKVPFRTRFKRKKLAHTLTAGVQEPQSPRRHLPALHRPPSRSPREVCHLRRSQRHDLRSGTAWKGRVLLQRPRCGLEVVNEGADDPPPPPPPLLPQPHLPHPRRIGTRQTPLWKQWRSALSYSRPW